MKLGIVGKGYVGESLGDFLSKYHDIIYHDPKKGYDNLHKLNECNFVFICVPTPMKENGECYIDIVEAVIKDVMLFNTNIIIKSTIPPGTTQYLSNKYLLNICFNPEFL